MGKYIVEPNKKRDTYDIVWVDKEEHVKVCTIYRYFRNNLGIANGICKSLNKGDIILDLTI